MKKFKSLTALAIMVAMAFCVIGCGSETENGAGGNGIAVGEGEATGDITVEEQVIYDNNDIKVTVTGYTQDSIWGDSLALQIENNSSKNITVSTGDSLSINGVMIGDLLYASVAAGKKSNEELGFSETDMEVAGITQVRDIEFSLLIYDEDSYDEIDTSDLITVTTSVSADYVQEIDKSGSLAVDEAGVKIYVKKIDSEDSFWGAEVYLLVENNTGKDIYVTVDNVSVNGFMVDPSFYSSVRDGKVAFDSITFFDSDLEDNGIESIDDIELSFSVTDENSYDTILETDVVKIDIK